MQCGACLPHCPTYRLARDEAESPRGRIALARALAEGRLAPEPRLAGHIDRCLGCRACEAVCPSEVPYGALLDQTRALLAPRRPPGAAVRALRRVAASPRLAAAAAALLAAARTAGLLRLAAALEGPLPGLARLSRQAPRPGRPPRPGRHPPHGTARGRVQLFTGCIARHAQAPALHAAVAVLRRLGYEVHVPAAQRCCGALHAHGGDPAGAAALAAANLRAFAGDDPVLFLDSGCGAQLVEYGRWHPEGETLARRARELCAFLAEAAWPQPAARHEARIALHTPCTHRRVLRDPEAGRRLLARIPGLEVVPLADNAFCCGAAGEYVLTHADWAEALRAPKIEALAAAAPDAVATTNIGCRLHLAAGLAARGLAVPVLHPVEILARALAPPARTAEGGL